MRRIIKPSKKMVEAIMNNSELLCYQYVNWWLYQKGSDEIIWSVNDTSELYHWCWKNKDTIISEIKKMLGAETPGDKYDWLLGGFNEGEDETLHRNIN